MQPVIKNHSTITLIGKRQAMTFAEDLSVVMWQSFMPRRHEIENILGEDLYSVQVYPEEFDFGRHTPFTKWATVRVSESALIPDGMEKLVIPGGLYAVFLYKGIPADAEPFFRFIFTEWLPTSGYVLDNRPHFEILGAKYQHNHPDSEEEVWIPIKDNTN
ncbi:AraC family transcriptional regulator [Flavobacterium silvisoli]|uniref:AraC family transcriptional regulator n=1 Tax=Flavobacterium silvisoli TaxID=2529433 RepID=A0A4Q9Z3Z2_9FLAO|nr:GyrI-like domain-containing protein [Flavobacterium silvisoli]TBX70068.1 AraC family transcriptional regulator [Flavobacterium silvisoli]